jgi:hypothetical protein
MRKLVASFFISLDGVVQGPGPGDDFELAGWTMPYWDDEDGINLNLKLTQSTTSRSGVLLTTYQVG